jgi:diguanylate cyclase (GGDEF)-like protein
MMNSDQEKINQRIYDPSVGDQGWAAVGRESIFTRMVLASRWNRQRFKESMQQQTFDKSRHTLLSDEKLNEYERAAVLDKVTGLYNNRSFKKKLHYELKRAKRYKRPLSLLVLTVDGMDDIRRRYGLLALDEVMKSAAAISKAAIRDVDIASRTGTDQISIIFPETYSSRALVVAERVREKMKTTKISDDLRGLRVTTSIGVVSFPTHARDEVELLNICLGYMQNAKKEGGDKVCIT